MSNKQRWRGLISITSSPKVHLEGVSAGFGIGESKGVTVYIDVGVGVRKNVGVQLDVDDGDRKVSATVRILVLFSLSLMPMTVASLCLGSR